MKRQGRTAQLAESLLASGWTLRLRVFGSSMKPLLRAGSIARIALCAEAPLVGDIVLYQATGGRLVAHRIIGHEGHRYRTKGDSSGEPDRLIERRQLVGKILGIEGLLFLPLDGPVARRIGLFLNRHYPSLVRLKSSLKKRVMRTTPRLAGEGS